MFIPKFLRLSDEESILQWKRIVPFVCGIPKMPKKLVFVSSIDTSKEVGGFRSVSPRSMGFLLVADADVIQEVNEGASQAITTIYKVNHDYPFIIRDIEVADLHGEPNETFIDRMRIAIDRLVHHRNSLIPSAEELKELADFLENADRRVVN